MQPLKSSQTQTDADADADRHRSSNSSLDLVSVDPMDRSYMSIRTNGFWKN